MTTHTVRILTFILLMASSTAGPCAGNIRVWLKKRRIGTTHWETLREKGIGTKQRGFAVIGVFFILFSADIVEGKANINRAIPPLGNVLSPGDCGLGPSKAAPNHGFFPFADRCVQCGDRWKFNPSRLTSHQYLF